MSNDEEIFRSKGDWTELRHRVRDAIAVHFPEHTVNVFSDYISIASDGQRLILVERIGPEKYRIKATTASGTDPYNMVGGKDVAADDLLHEIAREISP